MSRSIEEVDVDLQAVKTATQDRVVMYNQRLSAVDTRIDSLHTSVGSIRTQGTANEVALGTLSVHVEEAMEDIRGLKTELSKLGEKIDDGFEQIREGQAEWITDLSSKLWRAAGVVALIILGILGLVFHG